MLARAATALALLALLTTTAAADEPKAYDCRFTGGVTLTYQKGQFATEPSTPIDFGIAAINPLAQTADLVTGRGTGHLRIVQAVNAMHFLEVVTEGFLNLTTIYDKDEARGAYPAVHSRHFGLLGQPIVTQFHGFCEAKG